MNKKVFIVILLLVSGIVSHMSYKVDNNEFTKLCLENIEALASDTEGGGVKPVKRDSYGGKEFTGYESDIVYERSGIADGCIKWEGYKPVGSSKGVCYSID